ncbi:MAG: CDP-diacylglycerol--serine O-phosphatidyltransferase [Negativicutes bacterium]|nr:CDP-diacylglycerol--serine O-phosphatidyltransferase [Negativicutes bacterium]
MRTFIPNLLTVSNLIFGVFSLIATFQGQYIYAALWIVAAMIADGLDGRAARYFGVSSEFGKELDSLCDLASFGVAPAILAYVFLLKDFGWLGSLVAAAFATCGALRLARFNVNVGTVKGYFMGLPIPAGGCVVATSVLLGTKLSATACLLMVAVFAYLMVSTIKYPDFKGKGEKIRVIPSILALALAGYIVFLSPEALLFAAFFTYAVFGILNTIFALFDSKVAS